jgi:hypothetical protein
MRGMEKEENLYSESDIIEKIGWSPKALFYFFGFHCRI